MINISAPFRNSPFLKIFCLFLNRKTFQKIVHRLFLLLLPALCALSISTFSISSPSFQPSLLSSFTLPILMLLCLKQYSSSASLLWMFSVSSMWSLVYFRLSSTFVTFPLSTWMFCLTFETLSSRTFSVNLILFFRLLISSISFPILKISKFVVCSLYHKLLTLYTSELWKKDEIMD